MSNLPTKEKVLEAIEIGNAAYAESLKLKYELAQKIADDFLERLPTMIIQEMKLGGIAIRMTVEHESATQQSLNRIAANLVSKYCTDVLGLETHNCQFSGALVVELIRK